MIEDKDTCTACNGTGIGLMEWPANTKVVVAQPKCRYCDGTGKRKEQVFNWMKDPEPEKYLKDKK